MSRKAISYARVSTDEQAKFGYSLKTQLEANARYAADHDFEIVAELVDDCSGAIPILERPAGRKLYELVDEIKPDAVILYTNDRTARDEKVIEYLLLKSYLYERQVELHYADTGLDPYTMEGNLVGYIKQHAAATERQKIRTRGMDGKRKKAEAGKWVGASEPPYGFRRQGFKRDAHLIIEPEEADIVRRIFRDYTGADGRPPKYLQVIAEELTSEGVSPPGKRGKLGKGWYRSTLRRMIKSSVYLGRFSYGGQVTDLPALALIDRTTWNKAQAQFTKNKVHASRNCQHEYLLRRRIKCACGRLMIGHPMMGGRYFYYECAGLSSHKHLSGCPGYRVNSVQPDALVWQWLVDLLKDEAQVERGLRRIRERKEAELEPRRERLGTVGQLIAKEEAGITRLVNSLADIEDEFTVDTIKAQIKTKQKYRVSLVSEAERLSQELEEQSFTEEDEARIKEIAAQLRDYIDTATFKEMRFIVDRLDVQVRLRVDGPKRWLDCSCAFELPTRSFELPSST